MRSFVPTFGSPPRSMRLPIALPRRGFLPLVVTIVTLPGLINVDSWGTACRRFSLLLPPFILLAGCLRVVVVDFLELAYGVAYIFLYNTDVFLRELMPRLNGVGPPPDVSERALHGTFRPLGKGTFFSRNTLFVLEICALQFVFDSNCCCLLVELAEIHDYCLEHVKGDWIVARQVREIGTKLNYLSNHSS